MLTGRRERRRRLSQTLVKRLTTKPWLRWVQLEQLIGLSFEAVRRKILRHNVCFGRSHENQPTMSECVPRTNKAQTIAHPRPFPAYEGGLSTTNSSMPQLIGTFQTNLGCHYNNVHG